MVHLQTLLRPNYYCINICKKLNVKQIQNTTYQVLCLKTVASSYGIRSQGDKLLPNLSIAFFVRQSTCIITSTWWLELLPQTFEEIRDDSHMTVPGKLRILLSSLFYKDIQFYVWKRYPDIIYINMISMSITPPIIPPNISEYTILQIRRFALLWYVSITQTQSLECFYAPSTLHQIIYLIYSNSVSLQNSPCRTLSTMD